jgi:hypothetical protein
MERDAEGRTEISAAMPEGTGRNPEGTGCGASGIVTTKGSFSQGRQDLIVAMVGTGQCPSLVPQVLMRRMNRRIRNRMSGGVGGRRGQPRLLPDGIYLTRDLSCQVAFKRV